jgi:hypothetical protein
MRDLTEAVGVTLGEHDAQFRNQERIGGGHDGGRTGLGTGLYCREVLGFGPSMP